MLTPFFYAPQIEKTYDVGLVLRWSDTKWLKQEVDDGVKLIDLGNNQVEQTIDQILSCRRIITSSLHGLVIADAYGIPNAWLYSDSPKGREFKFYGYFLSVGKVRHSTEADLTNVGLDVDSLDSIFDYDDRDIDFDAEVLASACPLLRAK